MLLDANNQQLYRVMGKEYVRKIFAVKYKVENYDNKIKYKAKNKSCGKIKKHLIVSLKKYNIW